MNEKQLLCKHLNFNTSVTVNRLEDAGLFQADVTIVCADCGTPFAFKGLPQGLNLHGAATSPGGLEGRFTIVPGALEIAPKQVFQV